MLSKADSQTSLREAITQANANPNPDTISFAPSLQGSRLQLNQSVNGVLGNSMLAITPLPGQSGKTTITLTVTDGDGLTDTQSFELTIGEGGGSSDVLKIVPTSAETITVELIGEEVVVRSSDTVLQRTTATTAKSVEYTGSDDDNVIVFAMPLSFFATRLDQPAQPPRRQ